MFSVLLIVFVITMIAPFKTLITFPNTTDLSSVTIQDCYDGDTCTTTQGERIRLACIGTPELRDIKADPIAALSVQEHLNNLLASATVTIERIKEDRERKTVPEILKDDMNIQEQLVLKKLCKPI